MWCDEVLCCGVACCDVTCGIWCAVASRCRAVLSYPLRGARPAFMFRCRACSIKNSCFGMYGMYCGPRNALGGGRGTPVTGVHHSRVGRRVSEKKNQHSA